MGSDLTFELGKSGPRAAGFLQGPERTGHFCFDREARFYPNFWRVGPPRAARIFDVDGIGETAIRELEALAARMAADRPMTPAKKRRSQASAGAQAIKGTKPSFPARFGPLQSSPLEHIARLNHFVRESMADNGDHRIRRLHGLGAFDLGARHGSVLDCYGGEGRPPVTRQARLAWMGF